MRKVGSMKFLKTMLIVLVLSSISVLSLACTSESDLVPVSENQTVTVQRGDLIIDITAVGNLALSRTEDLAFEIAGTVEEVLVEEGDNVEEGQLLAELDASERDDHIEVLERNVTTSERYLTTVERALTTAENDLSAAERQVSTKEDSLLQAEINLKNSEIALAKINSTYEWPDPDYETPLESAQADVDDAERLLRLIERYDDGTPKWNTMANLAREGVSTAEQRLNALQSQTEEEVAVKELQVQVAQGGVEDARQALENTQQGISDAWLDIEDARIAIEDALKEVEDAQEELDEELSTSLEIIAPFDGFIIKVNVEGGDEVTKGTVAVQLADPTRFEAEVMVSEMDIFPVTEGGVAWVEVDALPGISLPARVTHISPTATIQSGVVNYKVTVEVQSLETVMHQRQETGQETMPDISSGQLPERLKKAVEEGRITQEQAEELMKQMQEGEMPFPSGDRQVPAVIAEDFQLREGLTVTVSILVEEKNNVLLVPNRAIIRQGLEAFVQVLEDGVIEQRPIKTGLSDWQYTEVIEGLSEGEKVVVPQGTTNTPTTPRPRGGFSFFGRGEH